MMTTQAQPATISATPAGGGVERRFLLGGMDPSHDYVVEAAWAALPFQLQVAALDPDTWHDWRPSIRRQASSEASDGRANEAGLEHAGAESANCANTGDDAKVKC
jgi:hypothetical protein